jgi:spore germination cell wall hydrolase CwlJ-like protein
MRLYEAKYCRFGLGILLALAVVTLVSSGPDLRFEAARATARAANVRAHVNPPAGPASPIASAPQSFETLTPEEAVEANAKVPISSAPNPPARPLALTGASAADRALALSCLTSAVYYEAANQGAAGEAAVAQVVLNRLRSPIFPKTVCGVVFEGSELKTGCQFTFTCDGSLARRPALTLWRDARQVAERALNGYVQKSVGLATHYHTIWVVPYWQSSVIKVGQIWAHIFYRMDGGLGSAGGVTAAYAGGETFPAVLKGVDPDGSSSVGAHVEMVAAPKLTAAAAALAPQIIATPAQPVEVATRSEVAIAAIPTDFGPPRPPGFFGHQGSAQRLPIASP